MREPNKQTEDGLLEWDGQPFFCQNIPPELFVAGGSILGYVTGSSYPRDIDVWASNFDDLSSFALTLTKDPIVPTSRKPTSIKKDFYWYDLVHSGFYPTMKELLASFDFTICQWGYKDGKIYATPEGYADTTNQRLRLVDNGHSFDKERVLRTFGRILKYANEFDVPNSLIVQLARLIIEQVPDNEEVANLHYSDSI